MIQATNVSQDCDVDLSSLLGTAFGQCASQNKIDSFRTEHDTIGVTP